MLTKHWVDSDGPCFALAVSSLDLTGNSFTCKQMLVLDVPFSNVPCKFLQLPYASPSSVPCMCHALLVQVLLTGFNRHAVMYFSILDSRTFVWFFKAHLRSLACPFGCNMALTNLAWLCLLATFLLRLQNYAEKARANSGFPEFLICKPWITSQGTHVLLESSTCFVARHLALLA